MDIDAVRANSRQISRLINKAGIAITVVGLAWFAIVAVNPNPIPNAVFVLGKVQCEPNEGLREVSFVDLPIRGRRFSFMCNNTAVFGNQQIPTELKVDKQFPIKTSEVVK